MRDRRSPALRLYASSLLLSDWNVAALLGRPKLCRVQDEVESEDDDPGADPAERARRAMMGDDLLPTMPAAPASLAVKRSPSLSGSIRMC